jgi:hypothetical protein
LAFTIGLIFAKIQPLACDQINQTMYPDLNRLDLESVRNLFLKEARQYLVASQYESPEELKKRKERLNEIEKALEAKKTIKPVSKS